VAEETRHHPFGVANRNPSDGGAKPSLVESAVAWLKRARLPKRSLGSDRRAVAAERDTGSADAREREAMLCGYEDSDGHWHPLL
jgi:hypothetical protein